MDERTPEFQRVVAYHEAGHAAVDLYFGHDVERISIDSDGEADGHVVIDRAAAAELRYEDDLLRQVPFERHIMSALAGRAAQAKFAPDSIDEDQFAGDRRGALEYFDALGVYEEEMLQTYWKLLDLRTAALVDQLWPRIEALANALLERKTLTGSEADAIFRAAGGYVPLSEEQTARIMEQGQRE